MNSMKKSACLFAMLVIFVSCNSGNKSENIQHQSANLSIVDVIGKKDADIAYTQCPIAYLVDGELFFHSINENKKVKFVEEPDAIYNFVFNDKGNKLYYSVERDNGLWMKEVDISESPVTPSWVHDWTLKRDEELANGYPSQLLFREVEELYHDGELLLEYDFDIGSYGFRKFDIYNLAYERTTSLEKESNWSLLEKFKKGTSLDEQNEYFQTNGGQLYYMRNDVKVCLTDELDLNSLRTQEDNRFGDETEFNLYTLSPDESKVLFKVILGYNEETFHGPYCIANSDGSKQQILRHVDEAFHKRPVWLKNNSVLFTDREENLFVTNNEDSSVQKIAENVTSYLGR